MEFYRETLGYEDYYSIINNQTDENEFISNDRFLPNITNKSTGGEINTSVGDLRIDVPVWFGDLSKDVRIVVLGLEPRDTDQKFNIERVGNKVFGTPFGVDRWNYKSSVFRKPQNKYFKPFNDMVSNENHFVLFSDVVKSYEVVHTDNKINDSNARETFKSKYIKEKDNLMKEMEFIDPTHIITLGGVAYGTIKKMLPDYNVIKVRHPSNGGSLIALKQINELFK